ncbi:hypothetical protein [Candidatus Methylacidiphilum infernorum]|uniref:Outer membrane receptor protein, mostly Fe transport n=1 Tax=Methylacidiphilum infernorum (isolate V4) TaxID=481448 RepID=B3DZV6_METI4|nr:hypothetical protein [Candidatus Methylacidiphilum infernorum]ACD84291.1 Hypothetical protein Minf_2237 [Methylacidiphilum infernorum V4]
MKRFFFRFVWGILLALNCFPWFLFYSHAQQEGGTSLDPSTARWNFSINIYNLTDNRHLWFPFGNGTVWGRQANTEEIVAGLPFWVQGTVAYRF